MEDKSRAEKIKTLVGQIMSSRSEPAQSEDTGGKTVKKLSTVTKVSKKRMIAINL